MLWDVFCRVVDNFGDVGVCWRIAADLASRGEQVRLWLDDATALVYHGGVIGSFSPGGSYTVAASYGIDVQHGDVRSPLFADRHIVRHVFLVRVTVAPRFTRSFLPPDEAARAKGVSP